MDDGECVTEVHMVKGTNRKKADFLLFIHIVLAIWAVLFCLYMCVVDTAWLIGFPGRDLLLKILATFNFFGVFVNIPLSVVTLVLKAKGRISKRFGTPVVLLAVFNMAIGIAVWVFVVMLSIFFTGNASPYNT